MHDSDCSQPTAAVQEAVRRYNEMYGTGHWEDAEDEEGGGEDSSKGGGGSSSGGGSRRSPHLPRAAHNVFRKWLDEHPDSGGIPTRDEMAAMAADATAEGGQTITKEQVRTHFNNKYVIVSCMLCMCGVSRVPDRAAPPHVVSL